MFTNRKRNKAIRTAAALAVFTRFLVGCGSGGGADQVITTCDINEFTPNFAAQMHHLLTWSSFPIHVYFAQDGNYTPGRQSAATAGFDQWVTATGGVLSYTVVSSAAQADVTVYFDATSTNGLATLHFSGLSLQKAEVSVGVNNLSPADIQCLAAHEFGHALGIDGESDSPGDLMYEQHVAGTACPVTTRDLNTMKTGYCRLFSRCADCGQPAPSPARTITIR